MICTPCRSGGKYATAGNPVGAELAHSQCKAPSTCPCQHGTESVKHD